MATNAEIIQQHRKYETLRNQTDLLPEVVDSSLQQCRLALDLLENRLAELEYPVSSLIIQCDGKQEQRISEIESLTGSYLPLVLKRWWEKIGGVSFVNLEDYTHSDFWENRGISGALGYCDGVYVESCSQDWLDYTVEDFEIRETDDLGPGFYYTFAPDGYHKDDISGGPPYGLQGDDWLPVVVNFNWSGYRRPVSAPAEPMDFLAYLRTAILECGGFPGLLGHPKFESLRKKLVAGLPLF